MDSLLALARKWTDGIQQHRIRTLPTPQELAGRALRRLVDVTVIIEAPFLSRIHHICNNSPLEKRQCRIAEFPGAQQNESRPSRLPYEHSGRLDRQKAIQFMTQRHRPFLRASLAATPHESYTPDHDSGYVP